MNLVEAYNLLVEDGIDDNQRYFAELYKHFQFKDTDRLKAYLDFILQEPVQWIHGFPTKLTTKTSFSKPKTAVIKLLKKESVRRVVGIEFAEKVRDVIWKTYKQEWENVLKLRERIRPVRISVSVNDQFEAESIDEQPLPPLPVQRCAPSIITHVVQEEETMSEVSDVPEQQEEQEQELSENENENEIQEEQNPLAPKQDDEQRIQVLKEVILKLTSSLEPSVSDAFRLLLAHV